MPTVQGPLAEGTKLSISQGKVSGTLAYMVCDLQGQLGTAKLYEALQASLLFKRGNPVDGLPEGTVVKGADASPWGEADAVVSVTIGPADSTDAEAGNTGGSGGAGGSGGGGVVINGGSGLNSIETEKTRDGKPIVVEYNRGDGTKGKPQGARVPVMIPQSSCIAVPIRIRDGPAARVDSCADGGELRPGSGSSDGDGRGVEREAS